MKWLIIWAKLAGVEQQQNKTELGMTECMSLLIYSRNMFYPLYDEKWRGMINKKPNFE